MIGELFSYWTFGLDAHASGEHNLRYHPVKLVVWALVAIAVSAVMSAVRLALFGEPQAGWTVALFPLLLPLTGAVAHKPPRYAPALFWGLAAGGVTAVLLGIDVATTLSSFWAGFAAVCAGFLVCSVVFAAIARPHPASPED
ncbi:hypothetical protein AB0L53_08450 [Nonomuraea sp. NPDC052129]|uniref:hypothetical protein n=1 Tax=Nonomuraea sp. NPDC052129 TaxID=3154651 RepID=UPI003418B38B